MRECRARRAAGRRSQGMVGRRRRQRHSDIAAQGHELWLVGIAPPATTPAGTYAIRASRHRPTAIRCVGRFGVRARAGARGLEVSRAKRHRTRWPATATRSRSSSTTVATLPRRSRFTRRRALGSRASRSGRSLTVQPGATRPSRQVSNERAGLGWGTRENVVESARRGSVGQHHLVDRLVRARRSSRGLGGWLDQLSTMPAQLTLRSVGTNSGVSPASLFG